GKLKKLILFFFFLIALASSVNGATIIQQNFNFDEGYTIKFPPFNTFEQGEDVELAFHVFNISNGYPVNEGISCDFHVYNNSGKHLSVQTVTETAHQYDYEFKTDGLNFSAIGDYAYIVGCNNSLIGGFVSHSLTITKSGTDEETIYFFLLLAFLPVIMGMFALFASFFLNGEEHSALKISMMLFGFTSTFATLWFSQVIIGTLYPKLEELTEALTFFTWFYGIIISVLIMYFLMYGFKKMVDASAEKEDAELKY
ncbi:unnamed protein product, partial [marine sediment metagenome]